MYISISYFAGTLAALVWFLQGGYDVTNSCMFTCVISHLIGLQVGCSGAIVETVLSYDIWRIPVLSCRWSFGLCRVSVTLIIWPSEIFVSNIRISLLI
jgi:hypothetical protein